MDCYVIGKSKTETQYEFIRVYWEVTTGRPRPVHAVIKKITTVAEEMVCQPRDDVQLEVSGRALRR